MSDTLIETTKLSDKGQIVIPKDFRKKMGLKPGTSFLIIATEGSIILQRMEVVKKKIEVNEVLNRTREITEQLSFKQHD